MQGKVKAASLKSYVGTVKWLQAAIVAFPIGAKLFSAKPAYLIPPLGTLGDYVIPLAFVLVGLFSIAPWFVKNRRWATFAAVTSLILCIGSIIAYSVLVSEYVVRKDIPGGKVIRVSVGTERTKAAKALFADGLTDTEMLESRGFSEEEIHYLWSESSILKVRGAMLASYILFFAMCNLFGGAVTRSSDLAGCER